jgi:soluble lytic murein transglycosylase
MKIRIQNIACVLTLFFAITINNCSAELVLDVPQKEALTRLKNGDISFIVDAVPSRVPELSKIHTALPFYAALLLEAEEADNQRVELLLIEALKDPSVRDAALKKLSGAREDGEAGEAALESDEPVAAGRAAIARRDYGEALRRFSGMLDDGAETFLSDKELLGDLGKAFQFGVTPGKAAAARGAELFLEWERGIREGERLWAMPESDKNERRYLLLYYAGRMRRQLAEYDEALALFASALVFAPDGEQADACIWYILDTSLTKNDNKPEESIALIKKYAPFWNDPAYFSDIFEKFTYLLCLERRWDEIAELFPYIRSHGGPELRAKYAFILGNAIELGFLTRGAAAAALKTAQPGMEGTEAALAADFYRIAYDSDVIAGLDPRSFYYTSAAAKKLGKEPRLNIPEDGGTKQSARQKAERKPENEFFNGFFLFGAARFAYPYIMEQAADMPVQELRTLAELLASAERWDESIRLARTYMQRPDYSVDRADIGICYPLAYSRLVEKFSRETGMDEALLYGLIRTESLFIPGIVSRAGAAGLTQLMPDTAREMARRLAASGGPDYLTGDGLDLSKPDLNINLGALYFQRLEGQMGSTLLALLAYNGGINRIRRWRNARAVLNDELFLESVDYAETRDYGRQVLTAAAIYRYLWKL